MVRKCSHCGNVGHNSRTCTSQNHRGTKFKLFGVQLHNEPTALLKKTISLDSLPSSSSSSTSLSSSSSSEKLSTGYLSDGLITKAHERKKGVPWSEEEHRVFLVGLEKLGKGDWRGISRKFVTTRTPTQVASHAQKYFLRLTTLNKRKQRRPSLFDAAAARDKLTVQVVEKGISNLKPSNNNMQPSSNISFGNPNPPIQNISKSNLCNWFGHDEDEPYFKFQSSSSIMINNFQTTTHHHHQPPDLQLSLSTPKPVEQVAQ
ncbi:probable transcription factor At5g61620 isoform X2 [Benincasa hispida]|uniref:probable transcription factor At5g61620 isoform X2 n=1 Tax=Benincasa hispida TaxID=102211 RepID=UPI0018FFCCA4|nr:probable transcription factor At5g61620 isoform X2 [Benincasa hispida]